MDKVFLAVDSVITKCFIDRPAGIGIDGFRCNWAVEMFLVEVEEDFVADFEASSLRVHCLHDARAIRSWHEIVFDGERVGALGNHEITKV